MNDWWRRCVKDRQSVRRMCRLVLVSCALGLLVCTALTPGYSEDMNAVREAANGKDHVRGSASSSTRKSGAPVWMGKKDGMGLNVRNDHITNYVNSNSDHCGNCAHCSGCSSIKGDSSVNNTSSHGSHESIGLKDDSKDSHDSHNSRGDHGAYDHRHGSFENDLSYEDSNSSKSHRRERNDNQIQRSINKKDEGNSSTSKDSKIGDNEMNKRSSHEKHKMSSVRLIGKNKNSSDGHNNHDGHGERNNSHENRIVSNNYRRNSFQRDSGREGSRIWRFMANGGQSSLGHRSHGNSSHVSGHKNNSRRREDSHRGDSYVALAQDKELVQD